jgi:hypothetical protein
MEEIFDHVDCRDHNHDIKNYLEKALDCNSMRIDVNADGFNGKVLDELANLPINTHKTTGARSATEEDCIW